MIIVRGIKGDLKLNPAIKLWGGLALIVSLSVWSIYSSIIESRDAMAECRAKGGIWIGATPVRLGSRLTFGGSCEYPSPDEASY